MADKWASINGSFGYVNNCISHIDKEIFNIHYYLLTCLGNYEGDKDNPLLFPIYNCISNLYDLSEYSMFKLIPAYHRLKNKVKDIQETTEKECMKDDQ